MKTYLVALLALPMVCAGQNNGILNFGFNFGGGYRKVTLNNNTANITMSKASSLINAFFELKKQKETWSPVYWLGMEFSQYETFGEKGDFSVTYKDKYVFGKLRRPFNDHFSAELGLGFAFSRLIADLNTHVNAGDSIFSKFEHGTTIRDSKPVPAASFKISYNIAGSENTQFNCRIFIGTVYKFKLEQEMRNNATSKFTIMAGFGCAIRIR